MQKSFITRLNYCINANRHYFACTKLTLDYVSKINISLDRMIGSVWFIRSLDLFSYDLQEYREKKYTERHLRKFRWP